MSLMSEVSVSSDSLVLAALVLPGFFSVGFLEEDTDALFFEVTLCFETCLTSSNSLSESVSTNCLDLLVLFLARGLAVADFFGTTLGFWGEGFFDADDFFFEAGVSDSSSLIGRGFALALVTNPDLELDVETNPDFAFFTTFCFFLFFSAEEGSSFFLGLLAGLLFLLFWELSESDELPDPLDEDDDDPEDEDDEEELEPEVLPPGRAFGGILT